MAFEGCPFEIKPYDQASRIKTPSLISLNYTNQDFWSMKTRLVEFIKNRFSTVFNDFVESDIAIMLIENWAFLADTLSFKIDQIANEIYIDTVSEIDNAFRISEVVGFKPQPPIAAKSMWVATMNTVLQTDMVISTPVTVNITTEDGPKVIELFAGDSDNNPSFNDDIIIPAGALSNLSIVGLEGESIRDTFSGNGDTDQVYQLSNTPVIWNSVSVMVDGSKWEKVDYFTDSQPRKEFLVSYDSSYNAYVIFGNSKAGFIPSAGSTIVISYRVGGGVAGNIVTGSVNTQRNFAVPGLGFRVSVDFRNYTKGEFGYDGDTLEDIKRKLPVYLRTQNRAVSGDDYKTLSEQFVTEFNGQAGKSTAVLRNYSCAANIVDIYILVKNETDDLQEANAQFKAELTNYLDQVKMITDYVCIKDGVILYVDVSIDVVMDKFYRKFEEEFRQKIESRITQFFSLNNWDYGQTLKNIDLSKSISDVKEIISLEVTLNTENEENSGITVYSKYYEIIRPNVIDISFNYE